MIEKQKNNKKNRIPLNLAKLRKKRVFGKIRVRGAIFGHEYRYLRIFLFRFWALLHYFILCSFLNGVIWALEFAVRCALSVPSVPGILL